MDTLLKEYEVWMQCFKEEPIVSLEHAREFIGEKHLPKDMSALYSVYVTDEEGGLHCMHCGVVVVPGTVGFSRVTLLLSKEQLKQSIAFYGSDLRSVGYSLLQMPLECLSLIYRSYDLSSVIKSLDSSTNDFSSCLNAVITLSSKVVSTLSVFDTFFTAMENTIKYLADSTDCEDTCKEIGAYGEHISEALLALKLWFSSFDRSNPNNGFDKAVRTIESIQDQFLSLVSSLDLNDDNIPEPLSYSKVLTDLISACVPVNQGGVDLPSVGSSETQSLNVRGKAIDFENESITSTGFYIDSSMRLH